MQWLGHYYNPDFIPGHRQILVLFFFFLKQNDILFIYLFISIYLYIYLLASLRLSGSQFPDQGLNPGHGSESLES